MKWRGAVSLSLLCSRMEEDGMEKINTELVNEGFSLLPRDGGLYRQETEEALRWQMVG